MAMYDDCCFPSNFSCNITLASWALDNRLIDLDFDGDEDFEFSTFIESNEWILVDSSASKKIEWYSCSHLESTDFTELIYSITVRRCVGFYMYALIIPSILLSFFMPLTFWIPTNGEGRITLGICLFVCLFVCSFDLLFFLMLVL